MLGALGLVRAGLACAGADCCGIGLRARPPVHVRRRARAAHGTLPQAVVLWPCRVVLRDSVRVGQAPHAPVRAETRRRPDSGWDRKGWPPCLLLELDAVSALFPHL